MSRAHPHPHRSVALTEAGLAAIARDLDRARLPPGQGMVRLHLAITPAGLAAMAEFERAEMEAAS